MAAAIPVHQALDSVDEFLRWVIHVNVGAHRQAGQDLAFINQDYRQAEISPGTANKFCALRNGKCMAHNCHVKMA